MTDVLYCPCGAEMQIPECWTVLKCGSCLRVFQRRDPLTWLTAGKVELRHTQRESA